jgi:hypothetical protein
VHSVLAGFMTPANAKTGQRVEADLVRLVIEIGDFPPWTGRIPRDWSTTYLAKLKMPNLLSSSVTLCLGDGDQERPTLAGSWPYAWKSAIGGIWGNDPQPGVCEGHGPCLILQTQE